MRDRIPFTLHTALAFAIVCGFQLPMIRAQSPSPTFDAASIKPNNSGGRGSGGGGGSSYLRFSPGLVVGRNVWASWIVREAYGLKDYQLFGGPAWIDSDRFDLTARADTPADQDRLQLMLQSLLAERFRLVVHRQSREVAVYALVLAKDGAKFPAWKDEDPKPTMPHWKDGTMHLFLPATMEDFIGALSNLGRIDRPVVDNTGLTGKYLIGLEWHEDEDIRTVVQEKLGLKLELRKAAIDALVIDRIEKPDAN